MNNTSPPQTSASGDPGFTSEQMKAFVRKHFDEFVNRKNSDAAMENFSDDFIDHDGPRGLVVGARAAKEIHVGVLDAISEGDKVMVRNKWVGTDSASGKKYSFHGFVLWRFANRKIAKRWATLTDPEEIE